MESNKIIKVNKLRTQKRILVICQHYWPESFRITDICEFLIEKDCEIDVLCGIPNYPKGKFFDGYSIFKNRSQTHNNVKIRRTLEIPRGNNTNVRIFINYLSFPFFSIFHIPRLLTKKYDKILIYQLSPVMMSISGLIVGKLKKIETTMYVLDLWPENLFSVLDIKNKLLRNLVTRMSHWHYRKADKLVALSNTMKLRLIDVTNKPNNKIAVLPQACEKIYEKDILNKPLSKKFRGGFNVLFTGNISPAQSLETIISAASILYDKGLTDIRWIIVGDGMSKQSVVEQVKRVGLEKNFHFEGMKPVSDIPKYNSIADVLVGCLVKSNLLEATIPAKVMSYIASGKPVVLAMDGEVQDLVTKRAKCGFVGPTEDAHSLAKNIQTIYKMSQKERNILGKNGRDYHFKHLERNIVLGKLYDFILA